MGYLKFMIACKMFEATTDGGKGILSKWISKHPEHRGKTRARVDQLRQYGVESEETRHWCSHEGDGIWKVKVKVKPQFRPHLCKGPLSINDQATFLETAIEENFELDPSDVKTRAINRRALLLANPSLRIELNI
jgi:hypothetical protein